MSPCRVIARTRVPERYARNNATYGTVTMATAGPMSVHASVSQAIAASTAIGVVQHDALPLEIQQRRCHEDREQHQHLLLPRETLGERPDPRPAGTDADPGDCQQRGA